MLEKSSNWGFVKAIHEGFRDLDISFPIRSSLSHYGTNSSQISCCAPSFSHRRHISAIVPQGKYIPADTDAGWPARMFECGLRKTYQHQITTCQDKHLYDWQCPTHREQYHLDQPGIRLLDGVLAVCLPESRMHFVRLGVSALSVNDKGRDLPQLK